MFTKRIEEQILPIAPKVKGDTIVKENTIEIAKSLITKYEGTHLTAYPDTYQPAICAGLPAKSLEETSTVKECEERLHYKVIAIEKMVERIYPTKEFSTNQKAALISLYFNTKNPIHISWRIQTDQSEKSIRNAWVSYHKSAGVPLRGLKKRRIEEVNLFFKP